MFEYYISILSRAFSRVKLGEKLFSDDDFRYVMNYALMKFRYYSLQFVNDDDGHFQVGDLFEHRFQRN